MQAEPKKTSNATLSNVSPSLTKKSNDRQAIYAWQLNNYSESSCQTREFYFFLHVLRSPSKDLKRPQKKGNELNPVSLRELLQTTAEVPRQKRPANPLSTVATSPEFGGSLFWQFFLGRCYCTAALPPLVPCRACCHAANWSLRDENGPAIFQCGR